MRSIVAVLLIVLLAPLLQVPLLRAQPKPVVSQTSIDFGTVVLLDSKVATFTIKNIGDTAFNFLGFGVRSGPWTNEFKVLSGFRPAFEPDSSIVVTVQFSPKTATATHIHMDSLHLIFPSIGDSVTLLLKGTDHVPMLDTVYILDTFLAVPGEIVTVPQYVTTPLDGALDSIYQFYETIGWDPRILDLKASDAGQMIAGWTVTRNVTISGQATILANAVSRGMVGSGELMRFQFEVRADAPVVSTSPFIQSSVTFGNGFEPLMSSRPGRIFIIDSCVPKASNKAALGTTILPNSPNPFRDATLLKYQVAQNACVSIRIFDARGNLVRTALDAEQQAGLHELRITRDGLAGGVYTCLFESSGVREIRKLVIAP
jgi:hypothetical protein